MAAPIISYPASAAAVVFHLDREILRKNSADGFAENL
jgi:hypothetical protein